MATHPHHRDFPDSPRGGSDAHLRPERIDPALHLEAAMRLIPAPAHERLEVARRFIAGTKVAGYDLSNMWGTVDRSTPTACIREVCLAIEGPGRTAMCFLSGPRGGSLEDENTQERAMCIASMMAHLDPDRVCLAQTLPEPEETWALHAYERAGFTHAGELSYMQLVLRGKKRVEARTDCPAGVQIRAVHDPHRGDRQHLIDVLDASYIDTLDCPGLCGLRTTEDVLESHLTTGAFDPSLWLLAFENETPIGCSLVSPIPENGSAELVYIGLAPNGRGRGLGRVLLERAISELQRRRTERLVCAVDQRNTPALHLYKGLGFHAFSARSAWVCPVRPAERL